MSRQIDTIRVSQILRKFFNTTKSKITSKLFKEQFKGWLYDSEANRLFEYYIDLAHYLVPVNKIHFKWANDVREGFFSEDAVRNVFLYGDIQTIRKKREKSSKVSKPRQPRIIDLTKYSDSDLEKFGNNWTLKFEQASKKKELYDLEMNRRKEIREKQEKVQSAKKVISELLASDGLTLEDLM